MKKIFAMVLVGMFVVAGVASAATLSVIDRGNGSVDVIVDDSSNVLGAAFTVQYDSTKLNEPEVTSPYFDTFTAQGFSQASADGYTTPLVTNDLNGMVKLAAACVSAKPSEKTLFQLKFTSKDGATGAAQVGLVPTEMAAGNGYNAGDKLAPLVGVSGDDYPEVLTADTLLAAAPSASIDVSVAGASSPGDFDGAGGVSLEELMRVVALYRSGELTDAADLEELRNSNANTTVDNKIDLTEMQAVIAAFKETKEKEAN